jgi:hypothetical protein
MELEVKENIEAVSTQKSAPKSSILQNPPVKLDDEPSTSTGGRSVSALRDSMRKKIEPESAAALPKDEDDSEEEDRFCYTKSGLIKRLQLIGAYF